MRASRVGSSVGEMSVNVASAAEAKGYRIGGLTIGECIELASELGMRVSEVAIEEAMVAQSLPRADVLAAVMAAFDHNVAALQQGMTSGNSFLMGTVGSDLMAKGVSLSPDVFLDKALKYTLGAQVGNHVVGLEPCAGTGDSCTYTGLFQALCETTTDREEVARLAALMLKVGTIFRVGKTTTGCNMEGFGAGAAATAAVVAEMLGGTPAQVGQAISLALSPTIAVPCTTRVMVAGLCAAHIGGGVLIGHFAAQLVVKTSLPVNVPPDVMISMAAAVHPQSAKHIVPTIVKYMEPFFKTNASVEHFIDSPIKAKENERIRETVAGALAESRSLSQRANSVTKPFGEAVVGGSSQAVGSPTNTARIAHFLAEGKVTGVKIELYPELFARRGINVPGIMMAALHGAGTDNAALYKTVMDEARANNVQVTIVEVDDPQLQRITIEATGRSAMVEALNRGGGRLALRSALPSVDAAKDIARRLNIEIVD